MKTRSMHKAERMSVDRISTLPELVLETILSLLPTEQAARTSILSREWRYKWTRIPELMFDVCKRTTERTSGTASLEMHEVHQVLLLRQGPIHELTLRMWDYGKHYDYFEFSRIIYQLSKNHPVKRLSLTGFFGLWYELPIFVYSLHHLTELYLSDFELEYHPLLKGFGSLGSLTLIDVKIPTLTLLHLLSNCPLLKSLNLHIREADDDQCTINELFECLPMIEDLTMNNGGDGFDWLVLDAVPQELPTSLIHLKHFCFDGIGHLQDYEFAFLLVLIKCSPNLEDIVLMVEWDLSGYMESPVVKEYCRDVCLEHLNKMYIVFSHEAQVEFLKFILARSPKLKMLSMSIAVDRKGESKMLKTLLRAPRASPEVTVDIFRLATMHFCHVILD